MKHSSKAEYHNALRNYFYITRGYVFPKIHHKIEGDVNIIKQYEERNQFSKQDILIRILLNFLGELVGTIVYCVLIIFVIKEVFYFTIDYTPKNILLLTFTVIALKIKFRLAKD